MRRLRGRRRIVGLPAILVLAAAFAVPLRELGAQPAESGPIPALVEPDFLLSVGEIAGPSVEGAGATVLGTAGEREIREQSLTVTDRLFVPAVIDGRSLAAGDALQFYRFDRPIVDPLTEEPLGRLLLPTGVGRVDSLTGATARVRVTDAYRPILVGDRVRAIGAADTTLAMATPPSTAMSPVEGHVVAFQEEKAIHPPYDVLFLHLPKGGALAGGESLLLYRPGPIVAATRLPDVLIGRAMVVRPGGRAAAAVLTETYRSDLAAGDRYRREFADR